MLLADWLRILVVVVNTITLLLHLVKLLVDGSVLDKLRYIRGHTSNGV